MNSFEPDGEFETTLQYERIDISEGIDIDKTNASKECMDVKMLDLKLKPIFVINVVFDISFQNQKEMKY